MGALKDLPEIRKIRIVMGWTQVEAAKKLGVSQSLISYLEKQIIQMSPALEKKIERLKKEYSINSI